MKATAFEFRFRLVGIVLIFGIGFWAPWQPLLPRALDAGPRTITWLWLGFKLSALGMTSSSGIVAVTWLAIFFAALAAMLRVWGTAYLGAGVVYGSDMNAEHLRADGPYRHVRNPLYSGTWLMTFAISMLMPPSGALFALVLLMVFERRLIIREEAYLEEKHGDSYRAYKEAVPRLLPSLKPRVKGSGAKPQWLLAVVAELMPIGVLVSYAALCWQYNADLLMRAVIISFGISLVARGLIRPGGPA